MTKSRKIVGVRVDAEDYKYLKLLALNNCQAIAGAISTMIKYCEKVEPITFCIWKVIHNDGSETYDVKLPDGRYAVCSDTTLAGALALIDAYRNEHGYTDYRRFALEKRVLDLRFEGDFGDTLKSAKLVNPDITRSGVCFDHTGAYAAAFAMGKRPSAPRSRVQTNGASPEAR
jgi:hypothetical protein